MKFSNLTFEPEKVIRLGGVVRFEFFTLGAFW